MKEEQTINGLPKEWKRVKVNDVCINIVGGGTPSTQKPEYWQGDIPWISSADIYGIKDLKPRRKITSEAVKNSATNVLPKGGIVVVTRVGLGKLAVAPYELCFSQDSQGLILKKDLISTEYALLVLHQEVQNFKHQSRGTTINGVTKKQLAELEITLPPLETQQQIVSKIEELFSELDKGIEELKTAQQQLKVYRQAVLKWAFEGKLTESFRAKNNIDFHAAIDKIFKARIENFNAKISDAKKAKASKPRTPKNLDKKNKLNEDQLEFVGVIPKEWTVVHLAAISNDAPDSVVDGPFGSSINVNDDYINVGVPVIRINNILPLRFEKDKLKFIKKEKFEELRRHNILPGDILFGKVGTIGNSCIYPKSEPEGMLSTTGSCRIRVDEKVVLNTYVCYYLNYQKNNFNKIASAAVQAFLNMETINNFPIPLCSIEEQQQIILEIESRLSVCDKIEETITDSIKQAEALRQSILKKAFEGSL